MHLAGMHHACAAPRQRSETPWVRSEDAAPAPLRPPTRARAPQRHFSPKKRRHNFTAAAIAFVKSRPRPALAPPPKRPGPAPREAGRSRGRRRPCATPPSPRGRPSPAIPRGQRSPAVSRGALDHSEPGGRATAARPPRTDRTRALTRLPRPVCRADADLLRECEGQNALHLAVQVGSPPQGRSRRTEPRQPATARQASRSVDRFRKFH
jgi:hypothetical protein